jgi:hypothetical protein
MIIKEDSIGQERPCVQSIICERQKSVEKPGITMIKVVYNFFKVIIRFQHVTGERTDQDFHFMDCCVGLKEKAAAYCASLTLEELDHPTDSRGGCRAI